MLAHVTKSTRPSLRLTPGQRSYVKIVCGERGPGNETSRKAGSNCTGGHHLGQKMVPVIRSRGVAAKQGFLKYYTKGDAIGTKVSVRYRESGRLSGVVVKRGSTVLIYCYGLHSVIDSETTKQELKTFNSVIAANPELKQLKMCDLMTHVIKTPEFSTMFPNLAKLAAIELLLPVTTVDCERGFSTLLRVKTKLRNRLSNKILNYLLMISIEGPHPTDFPYDVACDIWSQMKKRINVTE